jgi:hypothetical protein
VGEIAHLVLLVAIVVFVDGQQAGGLVLDLLEEARDVVVTCKTVADLVKRSAWKCDFSIERQAYVRRVLQKALGNGVLEALEVLVRLALVFENHDGGGRCLSSRELRVSVEAAGGVLVPGSWCCVGGELAAYKSRRASMAKQFCRSSASAKARAPELSCPSSPPPTRQNCLSTNTPTPHPYTPHHHTLTMAEGIDRNADDKMEFATSKEVTVAPTFEAMHLKENLLRGIYAYGYESPSAVQSRAIVQVCKGRDTIAQAQSGTGKTATFSISILQVIDTAVRETQGRYSV